MEEKKLTDEEIIKALDNCVNGDYRTKCKGCYCDKLENGCKQMDIDILDLIHRQKAEIERLTEEKKTLVWLNQSLKNQVDELKEFKNQVTLFGLYGAGLENGRKQGAKETAKVLTLIRNGVSLNSMIDEDAKIAIMNELRWVGQKFGVEVE